MILVFYVAPNWIDRKNRSKSAVLELIKDFFVEISMGVILTIMFVFLYLMIRMPLGFIIHPLGLGSSKEYGIIALCIFSLYAVQAIYSIFYTIVLLLKYPGFKDYYLKDKSLKDYQDYQEKKKGWGIINKVLPRKQTRLIYCHFYDVLEVNATASVDEIRKAYREKAQQYHPDKFFNASEQERKIAEKKFREIKDAYEHIIKHKKENGLN